MVDCLKDVGVSLRSETTVANCTRERKNPAEGCHPIKRLVKEITEGER